MNSFGNYRYSESSQLLIARLKLTREEEEVLRSVGIVFQNLGAAILDSVSRRIDLYWHNYHGFRKQSACIENVLPN